MKKLVATLIATGVLFGLGTTMAQASDSATHEVIITIPSAVMIRIMDGTSEAIDPSVEFDYISNLPDYLNAVDTVTPLNPTAVTAFSDVEVFSTSAGWRVTVSASSDSALLPGSVGVAPSFGAPWRLDSTANLFSGGLFTAGWQSLGFDGWDYLLYVDGSEPQGTTTITVTYTIHNP